MIFAEQAAQAIGLARLGRFGKAEENIGDARSEPDRQHRRQHGDGLHQRLGGAAGFRNGDEARGLMRQLRQQCLERAGIEIVHEVQVRRLAQTGYPRHGVAGELRQRLPAQAGAGGAEQDDIGGALRQPAGGVPDPRQIVMGFRQPQQRQAAVGMARAQAFERAIRAA